MRAAALLVALVACKGDKNPEAVGSGAATAIPSPVRTAPPVAAKPDAAPLADVPVQLTMALASAAVLDPIHAAVVSRSDGRCADAPRSPDSSRASAAATIGTDTVVALACGSPGKDEPAWTLGIARYDGVVGRALAVKHLEVADVQVDYFLRASATEVCVDYATRT